jgi:hypothetical protein
MVYRKISADANDTLSADENKVVLWFARTVGTLELSF